MKFLLKVIVVVLIIAIAGQVLGVGDYEIIPQEYVNMVIPQSYLLQDKWADTNNMSGYEFKDDGTVVITYANFNIPIINVPYNGIINGLYQTNKVDGINYVTINFSVFSQNIVKEYRYKIDNYVLTMIDAESGDTFTYYDQTID